MFLVFKPIALIVLICLSYLNTSLADPVEQSLQTINLELTTHLGDNQHFQQGDQISFMLSIDTAAYVYLFYRSSDSSIVQLIPNARQANHLYQPGFFIPVPDQNAEFEFTAQPPFGEDKVWVFATDKPVAELYGKSLDSGLMLMTLNIHQIRSAIKRQSSKVYGESSLRIFTQRK